MDIALVCRWSSERNPHLLSLVFLACHFRPNLLWWLRHNFPYLHLTVEFSNQTLWYKSRPFAFCLLRAFQNELLDSSSLSHRYLFKNILCWFSSFEVCIPCIRSFQFFYWSQE